MRFAFCIFKYFPYGGIQRDLMKVVRECRKRGHEVRIFTLRWQADPPDDIELEVVPIVGFNRHSQYEHFASVVNDSIRKAQGDRKFDLVVGFNKMPGLDVYYAGDSCYIEKALSQRDAWYRLLPRFKSFYDAERAVFGKNQATQILTLSEVEVPRYRHHYQTAPERFHPLPPGIERDRIAPANRAEHRREFLDAHGLPDDALVLLFIGSGFIKKGLDRALLAVRALPDDLRARTRLFVIGRDKADAFERMVMRLGLTSQVTIYAEGRDDVPEFLFAADALIHPAYDETAGMVIIEAILAGVPAVVTSNCGYAKYLQRFDAGISLPQPFSQEQLNRELVRLLTSDERAAWSANGIAAKHDDSLFALVTRTVDYLEEFAHNQKPLLIFTLYRYFPYGGLQRDFMRVARACHAQGYRIFVYCLEWQGDIPEGFEVVTVDVTGLTNHTQFQRFVEYVEHDSVWRRPAAIIGFNKMPGLDLYYAADSCYEQKAQEMRTALYRRTERYRVLSEFEHAVFAQDSPTRIMLIAPDQQVQFTKYYGTPQHRLRLLPPGISKDRARAEQWQAQRASVRAEFGIADDGLLLLQVGSGFITKGLDRSLEAVAALPDKLRGLTKLLVIGQDNPNQFLRLARSLDITEQLILIRGRDDIPAILQGADLMVHPAYMESGGLVLIEAVIAGLPVIATSVCGFAHYISDADAGVVLPEPFAQEALNQAVVDVLQNPAQRQQWSANGVAFGQTHEEMFDMPRHAVAFIKEYLDDER